MIIAFMGNDGSGKTTIYGHWFLYVRRTEKRLKYDISCQSELNRSCIYAINLENFMLLAPLIAL
jgi:ABC-type multidrug transport system ATPase subunit